MAEGDFDPTKDSYGKGEPIPKGMPSADVPGAGGGVDGGTDKIDSMSKGLADIQRERMSAMEGSYKDLSTRIDKGMATVEAAHKAEGVNPSDLKPFDVKAAEARNTTDPIAAFGSFASVFGILASTFTHAPFESALNASAAAMNAIKAGDKEGFERERKAWEDNTKLALDKHKIQHEQYTDAITLLKTNMEAGEAKMRVLAAKFGDQKALYLLENGMDKELIDLQTARQNLHLKLAENMPKIVMANAEMSRLFALGYDPKDPGSDKSQEALVKFNKEKAELKRESSPYFGRASTASTLTTDRQIAQDVNALVEEEKTRRKAEGNPMSEREAAEFRANETRRLKTAASAVSGNRADDLRGKINQVTLAETTIGHIEDMLKKHNAITGLGGKVTRPAEVVGNIFGSNETDRKQFERWVSELQEIAPRILLDSKGRPLSSEAGRVETIIAGLRTGDTTANTARAYYEFRKVLQQIKGGLGTRLKGGSDESAAPDEKPAPSGGNDWYKSAPLVH